CFHLSHRTAYCSSALAGCPRACPALFCCSSARVRRTLPSFPTRRSSDLGRRLKRSFGLRHKAPRDTTRLAGCCSPRMKWTPQSRSEEHTSELQSPDHLVCRLLLEKKKMTYRSSGS